VSLQAIALCATCACRRERSAAQPYQCTRATAGVLHVQEFTRSTSAEHTLVVTQPGALCRTALWAQRSRSDSRYDCYDECDVYRPHP
jgi:hypothetical protein